MSCYPFVYHESGEVPNLARDAASGQPYRGLHQCVLSNLLGYLAATGYDDPRFLTDHDAIALGAKPGDRSLDATPLGLLVSNPEDATNPIRETLRVRPALAFKDLESAEPLTHDRTMEARLNAMFNVDDCEGIRTKLNEVKEIESHVTIEHATWLVCGALGLPYSANRDAVREAKTMNTISPGASFMAERLSDVIRTPMQHYINERDDAHFNHRYTHVFEGKNESSRWSLRNLFRTALSPQHFVGKAALVGMIMASVAVAPKAVADDWLDGIDPYVRSTIDLGCYLRTGRSERQDCGTRTRSSAGVRVDVVKVGKSIYEKSQQQHKQRTVFNGCEESMMSVPGGRFTFGCAPNGTDISTIMVELDQPADELAVEYLDSRKRQISFSDPENWRQVTPQMFMNNTPTLLNKLLQRGHDIEFALHPIDR